MDARKVTTIIDSVVNAVLGFIPGFSGVMGAITLQQISVIAGILSGFAGFALSVLIFIVTYRGARKRGDL